MNADLVDFRNRPTAGAFPDPPTDLEVTLEDVGSSGRVPNLLLNFTRNPGADLHLWSASVDGGTNFTSLFDISNDVELPFMPDSNPGGTPSFFPSDTSTIFRLWARNRFTRTNSNPTASITYTP